MRKRIDPATPLADPSWVWSLAVSVTIVIAKLSAHPIKKTPKETSDAARALVFGPQLATALQLSVNSMQGTGKNFYHLHAKKIPPINNAPNV